MIKWVVPLKYFCCIPKYHYCFEGKSSCLIVWVISLTSHFYYRTLLLIERGTEKESIGIQTWVFNSFFDNEQKESAIYGKQMIVFIAYEKVQVFKWK